MIIEAADDDRTLVDHRIPARDASSEVTAIFIEPPVARGSHESARGMQAPRHRMRALMTPRVRRALVIAALLAIIGDLAHAAYRQSRLVATLRKTIDEMSLGVSVPSMHEYGEDTDRASAGFQRKPKLGAASHEVMERDREALEERGASLIATNNFSGALTHYQMLVSLFPDEEVFRDIVTALDAKLRCGSLVEIAGIPCP